MRHIEEKRYKVYAHINKMNGKVYIGRTKYSLDFRAGKNGAKYNTQYSFGQAIQEYGWDNFEHLIILDNLSEEESEIFEGELIEKYRTLNPEFGYNSSPGKGKTVTEENCNRYECDYSNYYFVASEITLKVNGEIFENFKNVCRKIDKNPLEIVEEFMDNFIQENIS